MALHIFDKLPTELLRLIFIKAVEDELDKTDPCSRRLKEFGRIARNVCARWKALIDNPADTSFWIARLMLDIKNEDSANAEPFAVNLSRFRRQLLTSKGCDLAITIRAPPVPQRSRFGSIDSEMSPYLAAMLQLMIHTLDMLAPYQSQITQVYWFGNQVDITVYLLELIVTCWKATPRLVEIAFMGALEYNRMQLPELLSLANIPRFDILPSHRSGSKSLALPITMVHLRNLTALKVPDMSWINGQAVLPPSICHLEILHPEVDSIPELYDFLAAQDHLRYHLRSISVGRMGILPRQEETMLRSRMERHSSWKEWQNDDQLILPALESLAFHKVPERQTMAFLNRLNCVSLRNATLRLSREVGSQASPAKESSGDGSSQMLVDIPKIEPTPTLEKVQTILHFPGLSNLTLTLYYTWYSLSYLHLGASRTVRELSLSLENEGEPESTSTERLMERFTAALIGFRPRDLLLKWPSYHSAWTILHHSTLSQSLSSLEVIITAKHWSTAQWFNMALPLGEHLSMPHLRMLKFAGSEEYLTHFLTNLRAIHLGSVRIRLIPQSRDEDPEEFSFGRGSASGGSFNIADWSANAFVSVRTVQYDGADLFIAVPQLASRFPDTRELRIDYIGRHRNLLQFENVFLEALSSSLQAAPGVLNRMNLPFPQLRSLHVTCRLVSGMNNSSFLSYAIPKTLNPNWVDEDPTGDLRREIIRKTVNKFLMKRKDFGALHLNLKDSIQITSLDFNGEKIPTGLLVCWEAIAEGE